MVRSFWVAAQLMAPQEGLSSVSKKVSKSDFIVSDNKMSRE
jgi:hypothetical protein